MTRQPAILPAFGEGEGFASVFDSVVANVSKVLHGKEEPIRLALVGLLSEGHVLVEDVPGVGKTTLAKALAQALGLKSRRIQFTPDLLPSDVTGVSVYDRSSGEFSFRPGPVFANVVIADEINRASPKTQAALLEAMQERQVTAESTTHRLPSPFVVVATQNPVDHEGTYPLPESQLDRFLVLVRMGYPDRSAEMAMLEDDGTAGRAGGDRTEDVPVVVEPGGVTEMIGAARRVHTAAALRAYVVDLADATRRHPSLRLGMSPRAALALQGAARALAASEGRDYVLPDDVKALFHAVAGHRVLLSHETAVSGVDTGEVLSEVLASVPVPGFRSAAG